MADARRMRITEISFAAELEIWFIVIVLVVDDIMSNKKWRETFGGNTMNSKRFSIYENRDLRKDVEDNKISGVFEFF